MKNNHIKLFGHDKKNKCPHCASTHLIGQKCSPDVLLKRIALLKEANDTIPEILRIAAAAEEKASGLQGLLKMADAANTIILDIFSEMGEDGDKWKSEYLERLDRWASKHLSQDSKETAEQDTEQLTLNGIDDNDSTEKTMTGESSQKDS